MGPERVVVRVDVALEDASTQRRAVRVAVGRGGRHDDVTKLVLADQLERVTCFRRRVLRMRAEVGIDQAAIGEPRVVVVVLGRPRVADDGGGMHELEHDVVELNEAHRVLNALLSPGGMNGIFGLESCELSERHESGKLVQMPGSAPVSEFDGLREG